MSARICYEFWAVDVDDAEGEPIITGEALADLWTDWVEEGFGANGIDYYSSTSQGHAVVTLSERVEETECFAKLSKVLEIRYPGSMLCVQAQGEDVGQIHRRAYVNGTVGMVLEPVWPAWTLVTCCLAWCNDHDDAATEPCAKCAKGGKVSEEDLPYGGEAIETILPSVPTTAEPLKFSW
jgi:hypothetical protein